MGTGPYTLCSFEDILVWDGIYEGEKVNPCQISTIQLSVHATSYLIGCHASEFIFEAESDKKKLTRINQSTSIFTEHHTFDYNYVEHFRFRQHCFVFPTKNAPLKSTTNIITRVSPHKSVRLAPNITTKSVRGVPNKIQLHPEMLPLC